MLEVERDSAFRFNREIEDRDDRGVDVAEDRRQRERAPVRQRWATATGLQNIYSVSED